MAKDNLTIHALMKQSPDKAKDRTVWGLPLQGLWIPFFTATNTVGESHINAGVLGCPLRLAVGKDGVPKLKDDGTPLYTVDKEIGNAVKIVKDNFAFGLMAFISSTQKAMPAEYKAQVEAAQKAGDVIHYAVWLCASRYHQVRLLEDMVQEANLRVWIKLNDCPDASDGLIWTVAYRAAYDFLIRGTSVDKPKPLGKVHYIVDSLEALMEGKDGLDTIDYALARRRRDELPNPTEDIAVARIMEEELRECLTPRQRQVLTLHLRGCTEYEISEVLGIVQSWVSRTVTAIREKAKVVWGDTPPKPTRVKHSPEERRELRRFGNKRRHKTYWARHREELIARQRAKRALHRDEINAKQRARRRERRAQQCPRGVAGLKPAMNEKATA